eukprot:CAMPEP_0196742686 /NCGR_PEP_ID=MMETSP1091-20130531/48215_1 /TAXON_ID=302021 /ORGANISM="Rhodomonas sp., Strain CCMP768" /LENGTH=49 /DNA_ID= /DNA_START= /DNA_END= /DNA_ORIENTATION=
MHKITNACLLLGVILVTASATTMQSTVADLRRSSASMARKAEVMKLRGG